MKVGRYEFGTAHKTYVMGILNVTPDSFSDGGRYDDPESALAHAERMIEEGAVIIDVGGRSARPGCDPDAVSEKEEIARVVPVIRAIRERFDVAISLDTCRAGVACAGLEAGADLINDIWGLKHDPDMARVIAEAGASCCLTHNRKEAVYKDFLNDVTADLAESVSLAEKAGIAEDRIMLDAGIGFGKTRDQSLLMLNRLETLHMFGYPILLGASRKSVIGEVLDLPVDERVEGTIATSVIAAIKGCSFVRVHDVKENVRALQMTEAILYAGKQKLG